MTLDVREVEVDHAVFGDEVCDALDALSEDFVSHLERIYESRIRIRYLQQFVVWYYHDGIDELFQVLDAEFRMFSALSSFERERLRYYAYCEYASFLCGFGYDRCGSRTCSAAHSGSHEYHLSALDVLRYLFHALFSGLLTDLRISACSKALRQLLSDLELVLLLTALHPPPPTSITIIFAFCSSNFSNCNIDPIPPTVILFHTMHHYSINKIKRHPLFGCLFV